MKSKKKAKNIKKSNIKVNCGKPSCCVACGNPAYPNCKLSCSMFDD